MQLQLAIYVSKELISSYRYVLFFTFVFIYSFILFYLRSDFFSDHLRGLVARFLGYRSRGPGFDSRRYQIFWEVVGLEWGPLSLVSKSEELLGRNSSGFGLEKPRLRPWGSVALTTRHLLSSKVGTNFADKGGRSVGIVLLRTKATEFFFH
jgi:hypothetical protein